MNIKKALGLGALTLWSLIAPALAKSEAKLDAAYSFINRPKIEYAMQGTRIGVSDENTFFGVEQQVEEVQGKEQTKNFFGAMVPIKFEDSWLRAEVMGSQEPTQNSIGVRLRYFIDKDHSLGPIVESLSAEQGNSTLAGLQGHVGYKGGKIEGGIYQLNSLGRTETLANGTIQFTAAENLFALSFKAYEKSQWYAFSSTNLEGDIGYRLRFRYDTKTDNLVQEFVLCDGLIAPVNIIAPMGIRGQGLAMVDITPEYPNAPVRVAGQLNWFLPIFYTDRAGIEITHITDRENNSENLSIDSVVYPLAYLDVPKELQGFFIGGKWQQDRIGNETSSMTTLGGGYEYGNLKILYLQQEGSKGEGRGYIIWEQPLGREK